MCTGETNLGAPGIAEFYAIEPRLIMMSSAYINTDRPFFDTVKVEDYRSPNLLEWLSVSGPSVRNARSSVIKQLATGQGLAVGAMLNYSTAHSR